MAEKTNPGLAPRSAAVLHGGMFFWVKKLIAYFLMPVPLCLCLLVAGAILVRFTRRVRLGRTLIGTGIVLFVLFSNKLVSAWLVRPLEFRYPAIPELVPGTPAPPGLAACRYVVVLGAGHGFSPGVPALSRLSTSARARITEAARLLRHLPEARLVLAGPPVGKTTSHATVLANAAISLGIEPARIVLIEQVQDTEDESLAARERVGSEPFALVTSAWHMPRAMALFRHAGMQPLPCPTGYTAHGDGEWHWRDLLFDVESLERSTWGMRERIGYAWIWLRGRG